jgi:hypothetical protein
MRLAILPAIAIVLAGGVANAANQVTAQSGKWSDPGTWQGGSVPQADADVIIASGHTVAYDKSSRKPLGNITIEGQLVFDDRATLELAATGNIVVKGELTLRPAGPTTRHLITFTQVDETKYIGGGMQVLDSDVGLWVVGKGILNVAGSVKTPWTRLRTEASAKQAVIEVEDAAGWQVGDRLEIVPTLPPTSGDVSWNGYDSVKITAVDGNKVSIAPALQYDHPQVNKRWMAEVLNLTRNVVIQGTPQGRAHMMLMIDRPQKITNIEIRHMGPRNVDGRYTKGVLGRYAFHFHLNGQGSRGSLVENVVIHDAGNHAFVPHGSHGIILRRCVSHNTWDDAFWWDPGFENRTNDTRLEGCLASKVRVDPPFRGGRLTGFNLGQGAGNRITDCVVVGVRGNGDSAGFIWPERPNGKEGIWFFQNNLDHNNKRNGIFTWQNTGQLHLVEKFALYHNGANGIEHGAYSNPYFYRDAILYGNGHAGIQLHATSTGGRQLKFKGIEIDGANISKYGVEVIGHAAVGGQPTWIENCTFKHLRDTAVAFTFSGEKSKVPEWFDIVNCSFPQDASRFFLSKMIHPKSLITVEQPDGMIFQLRRFDQDGRLASQWNACRTILQKPASEPAAKVEAVGGKVSENWLGSDASDWPDLWEKLVLDGVAPAVTIDKDHGLVRSGGSGAVVLMGVKARAARDSDQLVKFRINTNIPRAGLFARRPPNDADTFYAAEASSGRTGIQIFKSVDGKFQRLAGVSGDTIQCDTDYWIRFKVTTRDTGTDLHLKVWKDGDKQPAAWTVELLGDTERKLRGRHGAFGIMTKQGGNTGRRVWYDDYQAEFVEYRTPSP